MFCDVEKRAVVPLVTASNLYEVPLMLEELGLGDYLLERIGAAGAPALRIGKSGSRSGRRSQREQPTVKIALVGKYVELHDAYFSVREALKHAALALGVEVEIAWVHSSDLEKGRDWELIHQADGILVPGGFGSRGTEGKIKAIRYAREEKVPYLGLVPGDAVNGGRVCPPPARQRRG